MLALVRAANVAPFCKIEFRSELIYAMWRSFKDALAEVEEIERDQSAKAKASGLLKKILKFDFIFAIMLKPVIMKMTKIPTVQMQKTDLNVWMSFL